MFKTISATLNKLERVTVFIKKCIADYNLTQAISIYPKQKPWMNREIQSLLKTSRKVFKKDHPALYKYAKNDFHKANTDAEREFQIKLPGWRLNSIKQTPDDCSSFTMSLWAPS